MTKFKVINHNLISSWQSKLYKELQSWTKYCDTDMPILLSPLVSMLRLFLKEINIELGGNGFWKKSNNLWPRLFKFLPSNTRASFSFTILVWIVVLTFKWRKCLKSYNDEVFHLFTFYWIIINENKATWKRSK